MVNISVDSSILIQNLRLGKELFFGILKKADLGEVKLLISCAVLMEIWSGKSMEDKVLANKIEKRLSVFNSVDVNEEVAKKAGEIRRKYGVSGIDALIAATSILNDAELVTLNIKHFVGIKGLKLYEPEGNLNKTNNFVDFVKKFPKVKGLTVENYDKRYRDAMMKKHGKYLSKSKKDAKV